MKKNQCYIKKIHFAVFVLAVSFLMLPSVYPQERYKINPQAQIVIDTSQIEVVYHYKVIAPKQTAESNTVNEQTITDEFYTVLHANSDISKFWSWNLFKIDSILLTTERELSLDSVQKLNIIYNHDVRCLYLATIVKNYPESKISVIDKIAMDDYYYQENKTHHSWELTNDTVTVCGYLCYKAFTSFGGKKWIAWYAPELAISDGPWKLYGLPGLILKASDSTGIHSFEAFTINRSSFPIYLPVNYDYLKISKKDYLSKSKQFYREVYSYLTPEQKKLLFIYKGVVYVGKSRTYLNNTSIYCPLE